MPSDNVNLVREAFARWNAGERDFTDTVHPDLELRSPLASTRGEPYRGRQGFELWMKDIDEQFDVWEVRAGEFRDIDEQRVLVLGELHLRGRESGIEIDQPMAWLLELRDGMTYRMTVWASHDEALEAAGLS